MDEYINDPAMFASVPGGQNVENHNVEGRVDQRLIQNVNTTTNSVEIDDEFDDQFDQFGQFDLKTEDPLSTTSINCTEFYDDDVETFQRHFHLIKNEYRKIRFN